MKDANKFLSDNDLPLNKHGQCIVVIKDDPNYSINLGTMMETFAECAIEQYKKETLGLIEAEDKSDGGKNSPEWYHGWGACYSAIWNILTKES